METAQEIGIESIVLTPQEQLDARLERAIELRSACAIEDAIEELELALTEARPKPYDVKFQTRVRLAQMLTSSYLAAGKIEPARLMLAEESVYAESIFSLIQATGSAAEKRMATADRMQLRDLATQLSLIGNPAPEIEIAEWINGEPTSLAELRGQVILLEFWATWCKPCEAMFPKLKELDAAHSAQGLKILALTRHYLAYDGDAKARAAELDLIRQFVTKRDVRFPVGVAADERLQTLYGATGLPAVALIDRWGIVRYRFGGGGDAAFHQLLQACLSEQ